MWKEQKLKAGTVVKKETSDVLKFYYVLEICEHIL